MILTFLFHSTQKNTSLELWRSYVQTRYGKVGLDSSLD